MENLTHSFRETNIVLQRTRARERKKRGFVWHLWFISMYSVLNTLSEYTYFYISKTLLHTLFCLFLKPSKTFSVSLSISLFVGFLQSFCKSLLFSSNTFHKFLQCLYIRPWFAEVVVSCESNHMRFSVKKGVLKNLSKFRGKHLCQTLFFNKVGGLQPGGYFLTCEKTVLKNFTTFTGTRLIWWTFFYI